MVYSPVSESIGDKSVVTPEFVGIDQTSSLHLPDSQFQKGLTLDIGNHLDLYLAAPLQDPEDRDLACGSTTTFPFLIPPK